jgi:hypothetical protein
MIRNPFNSLLRAAHVDAPAANSGTAPAETAAPETETAPESGEKKEGEDEPEPPAEAAAPEAAAAAPKLTAFERGRLRMLGMGDLIARVEHAEGAAFVANAEAERLTAANKKLTAETIRLQGELTKLEKETPAKLQAAAEVKDKEVSKKVTSELTALGITPEAAPSQVGADEAAKEISRGEFDKLDHSARDQFFANGGKLKD